VCCSHRKTKITPAQLHGRFLYRLRSSSPVLATTPFSFVGRIRLGCLITSCRCFKWSESCVAVKKLRLFPLLVHTSHKYGKSLAVATSALMPRLLLSRRVVPSRGAAFAVLRCSASSDAESLEEDLGQSPWLGLSTLAPKPTLLLLGGSTP